MEFKTNSFNIDVPKGWHNQSMYIFSSNPPGQLGLSMVLAQEPLLADKELGMFKEVLLARLPTELGDIKVLSEQTNNLHSSIQMLGMVLQWRSKQYGIMRNLIGAFVIPEHNLDGKKVKQGYVLTVSCLESFYKDEYQTMFFNILKSIKS